MRYNTSNGIYHDSNYMGIGFWNNDDILNVLTNRRVGINTASPKAALEVNGQISVRNDGGWVTGGIRFQDTAGNNDAAVLQGVDGKLHFRAPSGNGSNGFEWWNGGATSSLMTLNNNGNVGIGTSAAPNRLIVGSSTGITGEVSMITAKGATGVAYPIATFMDSVNGADQIVFNNTNGRVGAIQTTGSSTAYNTTSDYRLKENIHSMDSTTSMEKVSMLNPVTFTFKPDPTSVVSGFIAHEVKEVYPDPVTGDKDSVDENGNIIIQSMDYGRLTPLLCSALKGVLDRLNAIEAKLA
jgi:hypothetical protein